MEWKLSEEQDAYREALRSWLGDAAPPETVREWLGTDDGPVDPAAFEGRFVRDGMVGVGTPESHGGQGGGVVELALTAEELARACAPSAAWLATVLTTPALMSRTDLVESAVAGRHAVLLVPAGQPPANAPGLVVDARGRVSGRVRRVLAGDRASIGVVIAGEGPDRRLRVVDMSVAGIDVHPRRLLDRSRSVADVRLDGVPSTALDLEVDACLEEMTNLAGVLVAADALGAAQRMLDLAVDYSHQRHQFGVPIGSFQAVKHTAATIMVGVESGRSGVYYAAASVEARDHEALLHAAAVKAQVTAEAARTADSALTVHGAIGYTWEHDLHFHYKRARLDEQLFGPPAVWNERLAERLQLV